MELFILSLMEDRVEWRRLSSLVRAGVRADSSTNTPPEGGRQEHNGGPPPPHQDNQAPNAAPDSQPFPPTHDEADTPSSLPSLVTASSSWVSSDDAGSETDPPSSDSQVTSATSEDFTSPKQRVNEEEGRAQVADRVEPEEEDSDGEEEEEEEEVEDAAATEDEKWEVESKEKEGDGSSRELEDVQLSVDESGGSSASMSAAGPLLNTGLGLTGGQQTGDQPMSLRNLSASSAVHRPETESGISPSSASSRLSPAVSPAGQVQEENTQARLTAGLLGDLPIDDRPDTAARDEIDPEMMAMLGRLRAEDIPGNGMGEPEEEAAVDPPEQATGLSNGDASPPQPPPDPRIKLQASPEEAIEGDTVDFELLNVPLHGIGDVEWKHNGRPVQQAFGLDHTISSVSQTDAGVYQCIIYREQKKINIVDVVEVTLHVKKSTDVTGQPCVEEEGGRGGSNGQEQQHPAPDRSEDSSMQTDASVPGSGNEPSDQSAPGGGDSAATSVLGATAVNPDYESLQQRYQLGQRLMKEHTDLSYYPFPNGLLPADQHDCVVMNATPGETTTPFDPVLEKLTATTEGLVIMTPKKTSPPNRTAPVALSIERKDSAQFMKDGSNGQSVSGGGIGSGETRMDRSGASGSSARSGEQPCGRGSSCPPGQKQKDTRCPDRSPIQPKKLAVPAQPDINPIYYKIPLSELMDDADLLDEVKVKLDQDCCGRKNWKNLGSKFGIPRDQLENFAYLRRCTEAVLERVSSESPETSVGDLMNILYQIKRGDVVDMIKQNLGM
ncbi:Hypp3705 [Branchiostoma lanceolatum]|uniref:Hypp3705 protein n=1 Tax=Branchiostoma lanceolatum TaxID=7740 RepID=A0A8K0ESK3_BRALA|nr:Hypp3705 [Branchiostoma lanceolatum]